MQQNNHHNIEDEQLRRLFADFNPPMSPASRFMERLERDMQRVEMVKEATLRLQRRNRVAVVLAALAGFVAGVVFMALYPVFSQWMEEVRIAIPAVTAEAGYMIWIVMLALLTIFASLGTYKSCIHLWPKVIMTNSDSQTMPMVVANLTQGYVTDYGMLMLAVLICTLPTAIVFFCLQNAFAEGITGAVK